MRVLVSFISKKKFGGGNEYIEKLCKLFFFVYIAVGKIRSMLKFKLVVACWLLCCCSAFNNIYRKTKKKYLYEKFSL